MVAADLNVAQRTADIDALTSTVVDVLVIGGGVTGVGVALDAASRGLRVGIVEAQDWAAGTSSRSSGLAHGGLRYLYQLNLPLVAEALTERGRLLSTIAPHLVRAQPFLWPLRQPVIERIYSALGVGLYDAMAVIGNRGLTVPLQRHHTRSQALRLFPGLAAKALVGAIEFHDARVDDARLVLALVRTACSLGAHAVSRASVIGFDKDAAGRISGVLVHDNESGAEHLFRAKHVIGATGVWTERTQTLAQGAGVRVLASKGIHIVVPRERIAGSTGMFLRTETSVLFIIPWPHYWVIGTTDTVWRAEREHPVPTSTDIDYLLDQANQVLGVPLSRSDIIGTWAGLRPLLQPQERNAASPSRVSREHSCVEVAPGLTMIAGGKLTTYRRMAEHVVDFALATADPLPSLTATTPLVGAAGFAAFQRQVDRIAFVYGWRKERVDDLMARYGTEVTRLQALVDAEPGLAEPLAGCRWYLKAEVVFACRYEGVLHLEDLMVRRLRLNTVQPDRGAAAAAEVAALAGKVLSWTDDRIAAEVANYRARVAAEQAAELVADDDTASRIRSAAANIVPSSL